MPCAKLALSLRGAAVSMLKMTANAAESQNGLDGAFSMRRFLLVLAILIAISYPGPLLGTRAFSFRDAGLFSYPVAFYLRGSFWSGHWPMWDPLNHCGIPFLAQWNTLALYPLSLFYVLLPMPWSLNCFLLGHLLIGGAGMYLLGRHWFGSRFAGSVAGLVFAWNGLTIHCLMWPCHTAGLAWMPWVVLLCDQAGQRGGRRVYWAALVGACQMLSGSPETIILTWLIVVGGFVRDAVLKRQAFWSGGVRLAWVALLVSGLSAVQMLPWLDLLAHGDRNSATGTGLWSLPPSGLANFFVPLFHSERSVAGIFMQSEQLWTSSYYVGVLPLVLALLALWRGREGRTLALGGLALAGVLLAWGDAGFVLKALKHVIPLLGFIRFPVKFIILTVFSLALLAGAGAAWLETQPAGIAGWKLSWPGAWIGLGILLVLGVARWFPFPTDSWSAVWPNALERLVFLLTGIVVLALMFRSKRSQEQALLCLVFLLCMGLDICTHAPTQNLSAPASAYADQPPPMTPAPRVGESRAMLNPELQTTMKHLVNPDLLRLYSGQRAELFCDCNLLNGIPQVGGFLSLHLPEEQKVETLLQSGIAAPGLAEFLGISQISSPRTLFVWDAQTNFMPWATIGQEPVIVDSNSSLGVLTGAEFMPRRTVYLPSSARGEISAGADSRARILSAQFGQSECRIQTSAETRTMLVVAQVWYHWWRATVDGSPVPLWRANFAYQALEVPAGRHDVRLVYVDRAFQSGAVISVLTVLLCVASLWRRQFWRLSQSQRVAEQIPAQRELERNC